VTVCGDVMFHLCDVSKKRQGYITVKVIKSYAIQHHTD